MPTASANRNGKKGGVILFSQDKQNAALPFKLLARGRVVLRQNLSEAATLPGVRVV